MHGQINNQRRTVSQASFADETPAQRLLHREVAWRDRQRKLKRSPRPKLFFRIRDLERFFADRYGPVLPNDDAGRDDIFVFANHLAHLNKPDQRIRAWLRRWAPWYGDDRTDALVREVMAKPQKWRADALAKRIGLDDATRTRLKITTIGATDCGKAKRAALRTERNNAAKRARRAEAGAASHAASAARCKPWAALGISRRTYYRKGLNGTVGTNSGTAHLEQMVVDAKQCHGGANARMARSVRPEFRAFQPRDIQPFTINVPVEFRAKMRSACIVAAGLCFPRTGVATTPALGART
jgi:hypothetical protein